MQNCKTRFYRRFYASKPFIPIYGNVNGEGNDAMLHDLNVVLLGPSCLSLKLKSQCGMNVINCMCIDMFIIYYLGLNKKITEVKTKSMSSQFLITHKCKCNSDLAN